MTQQHLPTAHPDTLPEQYEVAAANLELYLAKGTASPYGAEQLAMRCSADTNALLACAGYLRQIRDLLAADQTQVSQLMSQAEMLFSGGEENDRST